MSIIERRRNAPAQNFSMELTFDGSTQRDAIFLECRGFNCTQDVIEICEVTPEFWGDCKNEGRVVRTKLPGNVKYDNLLLLRGSSDSEAFWKWFYSVQDGGWSKQRLNGSLVIYDSQKIPLSRFSFKGAWPASYKLNDLNSRSQDLHIENLEVAFESMKRDNKP